MESDLLIKLAILVLFFIFAAGIGLLLARIISIRARTMSQKIVRDAEHDLDFLFSEIRAEQVLNYTIYSIIIMIVLGFVITKSLFIALIFGIMGYFIPRIFLHMQRKKRLVKFEEQLVPAIDLVANSLKSGLGLAQALEMITLEMKPPISQEFEVVIKENRLGKSLEEALSNMLTRIKSNELELIVSATNIARQTGGNLAETYANIAKTIRDRDEMQGKIKALTAEGRMQGIFVGALPFILSLLLTLLDPELMYPMWNSTIGHILMALSVLLVAMGAFFIKRIITIDI